jgi:hypothetical protein
VALGWTEEGGTGCRRAREGHKRGKGTHRWATFLGSQKIGLVNQAPNIPSEMPMTRIGPGSGPQTDAMTRTKSTIFKFVRTKI